MYCLYLNIHTLVHVMNIFFTFSYTNDSSLFLLLPCKNYEKRKRKSKEADKYVNDETSYVKITILYVYDFCIVFELNNLSVYHICY